MSKRNYYFDSKRKYTKQMPRSLRKALSKRPHLELATYEPGARRSREQERRAQR